MAMYWPDSSMSLESAYHLVEKLAMLSEIFLITSSRMGSIPRQGPQESSNAQILSSPSPPLRSYLSRD